jgi:hypothetical protein
MQYCHCSSVVSTDRPIHASPALRQAFLASGTDRNPRAFFGEFHRDCLPNPLAGSGNQNSLVR